jgi:DNA-binding CsgD family transcriptional regulator
MNGGKPPSLSIRQAKALALVTQGWSFGEIGRHLKIAPRVVLLYMVHLQRYLGTRTPGELTQTLLEARLIPVEWARDQTRRRRLRKQLPAPPATVPAGSPGGEPGGDGSA